MKINELMIGDFVTFKDYQEDKAPFGVKIIARGHQDRGEENAALVCIDGAKTFDIIEIDDEIVGIPLTPEILEKNGFTNCETSELDRERGNEFWYPGEDNYISDPDLMINLGKHSFLVRFTGSTVWKLHYVHELQHFLRLVNYDKEIVL